MGRNVRFSLFGIPVHVRPIFWVVVILLGLPASSEQAALTGAATWVMIVFVSVLAHELGHAFAMRAFGRAPSIELWGMGGLTSWGDGPTVSRTRSIAVSLAGPGAGFVLALPVALYAAGAELPPGSLPATVVDQILWVNVGWGLLNLLPILPLDGGHVMESALASMFGANGPRYARYVSIAAAVGAGALALAYGMMWGAMIAFFSAMYSFRTLNAGLGTLGDGTVPAQTKVDPALEERLVSIWAKIQTGKASEAVVDAEALLGELTPSDAVEDAPHRLLRAQVVEALAWAHVESGDEHAARAAVERLPDGISPSALLAARLTYGLVDRLAGLRALEMAFHDSAGELAGLVLGAVYVEMQRPDDAVAMLRTIRGASLHSATYRTIAAALFYADDFAHARDASELAWNRFKEPTHAYNVACSCARLGRVDEGLDWLERAIAAGYADRPGLEADSDLDALRASERYGALVARLP